MTNTSSTAAVVAAKRTALPTPRPKPKPIPRWAVVLFNDEIHTIRFVTETICKVLRCSTADGQRLTMKIHREGRGIVWTGPREVAEFRRDQLRSAGPDFHVRPPVRVPLKVEIQPMACE